MKRERYRLLQNTLKKSTPEDWLRGLQSTERCLSNRQWRTGFFICPLLFMYMHLKVGMKKSDAQKQLYFWYRSLRKDFPDIPWKKEHDATRPWFTAGLKNERLAIVRHLISELKRIYKLEDSYE